MLSPDHRTSRCLKMCGSASLPDTVAKLVKSRGMPSGGKNLVLTENLTRASFVHSFLRTDGLKGQDMPAQGIAMGQGIQKSQEPCRGLTSNVAAVCIALSGLINGIVEVLGRCPFGAAFLE